MLSQDRFVRNPPQYGTFEDTQEELDWYGSNPEDVDRDRTPDAVSLDKFMALNQEQEDESDPSNDERSRGTYSDASRSPSLPSLPPTTPPSSGRPLPALISRKRPEEGPNVAKQPP